MIDAALSLRRKIDTEDIESTIEHIQINTYQAAVDVCDRPLPNSEYEAKFSLFHTVAIALLTGEVNFASFNEKARVLSRKLSKRINVVVDAKVHDAYPASFGGEVIIHLHSGEVLALHRHDARGDPEAPLTRKEMIDKADFLLRYGGVKEPSVLIESILATIQDGPLPRLPFCR